VNEQKNTLKSVFLSSRLARERPRTAEKIAIANKKTRNMNMSFIVDSLRISLAPTKKNAALELHFNPY
jgi:hypothetical protein